MTLHFLPRTPRTFDDGAPSMPSPLDQAPAAAEIAVAVVIADIVHELRRARVSPVPRIKSGPAALSQQGAVTFGWLAPSPNERCLVLTPSGRQALADAGKLRG